MTIKKPILFMHIPKTAGISVLTFLEAAYTGARCKRLRWQDNSLNELKDKELREADFVWLHEPLCDQ